MFFPELAWAMPGAGGGGEGGGGAFGAMIPLLLMLGIFYFLLIRPQQKKAKMHREMLSAINKGDVIVTQGGIQGKVTGVTDAYLTVEIADKVRVKIARNFISAKVTAGEAPPAPDAKK